MRPSQPNLMDDVNAQIIDRILQREGKGKLTATPDDKGGPTFEGLSQAANPDAFKNGPPTDAQVRAIYLQRYLVGPGFDKIGDTGLRESLTDWGVNSGPMIAIQALQRLLGLAPDGILGPQTLAAANAANPRVLGNHLVMERCLMLGRVVARNPTQATFIVGWLTRALSFLAV